MYFFSKDWWKASSGKHIKMMLAWGVVAVGAATLAPVAGTMTPFCLAALNLSHFGVALESAAVCFRSGWEIYDAYDGWKERRRRKKAEKANQRSREKENENSYSHSNEKGNNFSQVASNNNTTSNVKTNPNTEELKLLRQQVALLSQTISSLRQEISSLKQENKNLSQKNQELLGKSDTAKKFEGMLKGASNKGNRQTTSPALRSNNQY